MENTSLGGDFTSYKVAEIVLPTPGISVVSIFK